MDDTLYWRCGKSNYKENMQKTQFLIIYKIYHLEDSYFQQKKEECSVSKTLVARSSLFIFVTRNTGTFLPEGKGLQASPALIWKFKKKCPIFVKKCPDCVPPWLNLREKTPAFFLLCPLVCVLQMKCSSKRNLPSPERSLIALLIQKNNVKV